jgi:signal transduction histidine kinase
LIVARQAARFAQTSLAAWLAAAILLGILVSILPARRLVKPLATLAEVVERAGVTGTAMAMPTGGPREIQAIIEAFNRMQGRLSRFIEDRTRMIAAISHDLRTPLTRLQLRLESPDVLAERQRMLADLHAMGEMIDSVISFAQEDTSPTASLILHDGLLPHLSAARTSWQCARQSPREADTQGCD